MSGLVHPLKGSQAQAVDPADSVWLSASAGTGKTQVLSARVLRLLLEPGVSPSQILCLTFTKAGAAEMAVRVNEVLASWVRMKPEALARDLLAIGADISPAAQDHARTLFASVLDCPGGGLRIDTIHAFAQWLLSAFPEEAGLMPGTRAMEDRDRDLLAREVLAEMLVRAEEQGDRATLDAVEMLSLRMGPEGVESWLMRCAGARDLWLGHGAWVPPLEGRVKRLLGLPEDASEASMASLCCDEAFDVASLRLCMAINSEWKAKTGQEAAANIGAWLSATPDQRAESISALAEVFLTKAGAPRATGSQEKIDPAYPHHVEAVLDCVMRVLEVRTQLALAEWLTPALAVGRTFALAWDEAKQREGLIDFDDQIRTAAALLGRGDLATWIRYKLDRQFDHVLIDEAQDTNSSQWDIVFGLIGDYFAGEGARGDRNRTVFTVGDYKQAIFRFQGTSPENFEAAKLRVMQQMGAAAENARALRASFRARELQDLGLDRSYRTGQPVLDFVDRAIGLIGHAQFGLKIAPELHVGDERPGLVAMWPVIGGDGESEEEGEEGREGWLSRPDRLLADRIAQQVRHWLDDGFPLVKGVKGDDPPRRAGPGDVLVLVRKRKELAGLIVARLYAAGVPVAGVDRLRLGAPLAVKDCVAALRFAAQPFDDLNLANWLVSPLGGWSQEDLLTHGCRPEGVALWDHLRRSGEPMVAETLERLGQLLAIADFEPPQALLHWILAGPWDGRRKLVARLGREANDPLDELLNAALAYAASHTPSLQGFLQWFDAGEGELKRESGGRADQVRVMTVHGSKGLQAPIVILADAAGNPKNSPTRGISLIEPDPGGIMHRHAVPIPPLTAAERAGRVAEAHALAEKEEMQEHWRLLYVAMTRAEEALFIGGSLGLREKAPAELSWYGQLQPLFAGDPVADPVWGERREWGKLPDAAPEAAVADAVASLELPDWVNRPVGPEPRPPRPLAPSSAGNDDAADPPLAQGLGRDAARRGTLIHALLERLPELPHASREAAATAWLARNAADLSPEARKEMIDATLAVLSTPDWAEIFGPDALAEVPFAATVDGQVIAGTIDRLLLTPDCVTVVDFKTARRPPAALDQVPQGTLRQMAAYVAALEAIYPGRRVEAALLYTQTPRIIPLPPDIMEAYKPGLTAAQ